MNKTKTLLFRIGAVALLLAVAAVMMVIGRGHTVYLDNKSLEYNGQTYEAPYKVVAKVKGEQVAKLYARERGSTTNIGQSFEVTLEITQDKGGEEQVATYKLRLPYAMDGVVINLPGFLAGLPEEAYLSEFVSLVPEAAPADSEEVPGGEDMDEFEMGEF